MSEIKLGFTAKQMIEKGRLTREDIDLLKNWLATENFPKLTDEQVVLFLLSCQNQQEATKATIKAFYSIRARSPEVFSNRRMEREDLQKEMRTIGICIMPERTDNGYAVIYGNLLDTNYVNFDMTLNMMHLFMVFDAVLYDDPPKGFVMVYDMKGMGFMHATRMRLGLMRIYFQYLQEGLPLRLREGHILNSVSFADKLMTLFKPFIKKEVLEMAYFHQSNMDMEQFYKNWVPKRCLPEELGGDLPSVRVLHENTVQKLMDMQSYFDAEELQRRT